MKKQMQERPGNWRLLIGSVLILCAGMGLATANDLSFPLSDAIDGGRTANGSQQLLVRFVDGDGPSSTCSELVGPLTKHAVRNAICDAVVEGASVESEYDGLVTGLATVSLPEGVAVADAMVKFTACEDVLYAEPVYGYSLAAAVSGDADVAVTSLDIGGADGVSVDAAVAAIEQAVAAGAKVIHISWTGSDYSESLRDAIEAAGEEGVLFVVAAGDESRNIDVTPVYPAGYDSYNIISVLATNEDGEPSWSSNYGRSNVDLGSTADEAGGSGAAASEVARAAAMLFAQNPDLSALQVKHALMQTTDKVLAGLTASQGRLNLVAALTAAPTGQAGRVVNTRDLTNFYSTIQAAIDDANDGDVIIAETLATGNTVYKERIDFKGKAITLRSGNVENPDDPNLHPETTFIIGVSGQEGSIVTFANGEGADTVLRGLTIGWGVAEYGGGIRIEEASPTIDRCIITDNQAQYYGGGIDCFGGSPTIIDTIIQNNEVLAQDGLGGGINCEDGSPAITHCVIGNNSSMNLGGGMACYNANPTLFNCFVTNNSAASGSGQFDLEDSSPSITNCTIAVDENPPGDGGIWCSGQSNPTITNCILWGNGDDLLNCFASYSCVEDGDAGEGNISVDPLLIAGPLGSFYLSQIEAGQLVDSPCLDASDPNVGASLAARTTRTDGGLDAGAVDMGAHYSVTTARLFPLNL
ncbi:MAG TPA: S8 family serine peptidase, partial [Sedimentisphaerales bacterium]|nr:S8 family serine peptidase [Sedimentisphaerales bacterium]